MRLRPPPLRYVRRPPRPMDAVAVMPLVDDWLAGANVPGARPFVGAPAQVHRKPNGTLGAAMGGAISARKGEGCCPLAKRERASVIGRAPCRARVRTYVLLWVVAVTVKNYSRQ